MLSVVDPATRLKQVSGWTSTVQRAIKRREDELWEEGRFTEAFELIDLRMGLNDIPLIVGGIDAN